jgi:hypothetical protein
MRDAIGRPKTLSLCLLALGITALLFAPGGTPRGAAAATTAVGPDPIALTVRTGQTFYVTIAVADVTDLYAWQADVTYSATYLEYVRVVAGDFLCPAGTSHFWVPPVTSPGLLDNLADTRLSEDAGVDGSGHLFYVVFRALSDTSGTNVRVTNARLVDRNALEIDKTYINSGNCRVTISATAPVLIQPPLEDNVYLPQALRNQPGGQ